MGQILYGGNRRFNVITTLEAAAVPGQTQIRVVSADRLAAGTQLDILNPLGERHSTTIVSINPDQSVTLANAIPANWTSAHRAPIGSPVGTDQGVVTTGGGGGAVAKISAVGDVSAARPTTGDVITWDGAIWSPAAPPTSTRPSLGQITDVSLTRPTQGQMLVFDTSNGWENTSVVIPANLNDLTDVTTAGTIPDGNVLVWDGRTGNWKDSTPASGVTSLPALSDVNIALTPTTDGVVLTWDNAAREWQPKPPVAPPANLDDLTDVNAATPADGQALTWNDTAKKWGATTISAAGAIGLNGLNDVDTATTPPNDGEGLKWDDAAKTWKPGSVAATAPALDDLTDVDEENTAPKADKSILQWNDTDKVWEAMLLPGVTPVGDTDLDMQTHNIFNMADPRTGPTGAQDATTRDWVNQAIAAQNLYQGIYKPKSNSPNLRVQTDAQAGGLPYDVPVADDKIAEPAPSAPDPAAGNIMVWFEVSSLGPFPLTINKPIQVTVQLSDMSNVQFNVAPNTYAAATDLEAHLQGHVTGTSLAGLEATTVAAKTWVGVETTAPLYALDLTPKTGGGHPAAAEGPNGTVLNSYNWVVSTTDPNVPEPAPIGLPGIAPGTLLSNSDLLQWSGAASQLQILKGGNLTQAFADTRYWRTTQGNMTWKDQAYNQGAVVLDHDAWWTSVQNIPPGFGRPGSVQAGAAWKKINATYGATTFFGSGDYDQADTTATGNWGMPAGTYPAGQQPVNGDVYYDVSTGSVTEFRVTNNPSVYVITGTVDKSQPLKQGDMDIGASPSGFEDLMRFTVDGQARGLARNAFYEVTVPAVAQSINLKAAKSGDMNVLSQPPGTPAVGDWYAIPNAIVGATPGDAWNGVAALANSALVYTGLNRVSIPAVEGYETHSGWMLVPNPPAGGAALSFNLRVQATGGAFAGQTITPGRKLVVWSGDPDADDNGWVVIEDQVPRDWSIRTPHGQKVADTVRGVTKYGYQRRFTFTYPAAGIDVAKTYIMLQGIESDNALYYITILDHAGSGSVYKLQYTGATTAPPRITGVSILASNTHIEKFFSGWTGSTTKGVLAIKPKADIAGITYDIIITSDNHDLNSISLPATPLVEPSWTASGKVERVDGTKNYPSKEADLAAAAASGDAQAAQLLPDLPVGTSMTGRTVTLDGSKIYRARGHWLNNTSDDEAFISIDCDSKNTSDGKSKITKANCYYWKTNAYTVHEGYNQPNYDLEPADHGFLANSYGSPKKSFWHPFEFTMDLRDKNLNTAYYKCCFRGTDNKDYVAEFWIAWDAAINATGFYFSNYKTHSIDWRVFLG